MTPPDRHCALCGADAPPSFCPPAPESAPDLDLRPGEPTRSTLPDWLQTCARCSAAAPDLAALPAAALPVVESAPYRALITEGPDYALAFLRWAMICNRVGDRRTAAEAMLQAAWAADDAADSINAARWRAEAAFLWGEPADAETALRRIDALRCAAEFGAADAAATRLEGRGLDATGSAVLAFQRDRINRRDIGRHLVTTAVRPSERRPPTAPNLLGRLFGNGRT